MATDGVTVAVTEAGSALGAALLERLDADRRIGRILGLGPVEPQMPVAKLDYRPEELAGAVAGELLAGAEVVVHLASPPGAPGPPRRSAGVDVGATRELLTAAGSVGVRKIVHLSSGLAYGAHPDNDVPLRESTPLRANPDFDAAYRELLAEELVAEWAAAHPGVTVTVLRSAVTLGPGVDDAVSRHLASPCLPLVRGYEPPLQVVHVDDLAAALHHAVVDDLPGAYNVAADGWLSAHEVAALLGRRLLPVPETVAYAVARLLWERGLSSVPPGALAYLMHPWVLATDRLHAAGWAPTRSNRQVLREFAAAHHDELVLAGRSIRRSRLRLTLAVLTVGLAGFAGAHVIPRRLEQDGHRHPQARSPWRSIPNRPRRSAPTPTAPQPPPTTPSWRSSP
jgi:nucleoside-diphosphate-sugar epimerase